jgi:hypothetical protein
VYLNTIANSVIQAREALAPSTAGNPSYGWVAYSYRTPDDLTNTGLRSGDASRAELTRALTQPSEYDPVTPPVLAEPAGIPEMTWKTQPTTGHLAGTVRTSAGVPFDQVRVDLLDADTDAFVASMVTDGGGWFAFVDVAPDRYKVVVDEAVAHGRHVAVVTVSAGDLSTVSIRPKMT